VTSADRTPIPRFVVPACVPLGRAVRWFTEKVVHIRAQAIPVEPAGPAAFLQDLSDRGFVTSTSSSIPLYYQLYLILQRAIRDGRLEVGARFPAEDAIASHFAVSRPTANRAVQELINHGWLQRKRGRGTFVDETRLPQLSLLNDRLSFSDEIGAQENHRTRFIRRTTIAATTEDAEALRIPSGDRLVFLRRLHSVGDRVVMVCDSKLPATRFPKLETIPFVDGSLFKTLECAFHCPIRHAERCVEAAQVLDQDVASLLQVPQFAPVLLMSGKAFDKARECVELMTAYVKEGTAFRTIVGATPRKAPERRADASRRVRPPAAAAC